MPGDINPGTRELLRLAAEAHFELLSRAVSNSAARNSNGGSLLATLRSLLDRQPNTLRRRILVDPVFVEGLHAGSTLSPILAQWHGAVASRSMTDISPSVQPDQPHLLENSILILRLRNDPNWHGRLRLRTDMCGRLRFPLSNWSIALFDATRGPKSVLSNEAVAGTLTRNELRLTLFNEPCQELVTIPRHELLQMLIGNDDRVESRRLKYGRTSVGARAYFAGAFPGWRVRYDPVFMLDFHRHAPLTGGLVAAILGVIRHHSPRMATELDSLLHAIRGCELPVGDDGTLQSFSDPAMPRNMWINVPYGADDAPRVCPFCFTWFGHELAHTKSYLIETILFLRETGLTTTPARRTEVIQRYGRPIAHRTLLQIPYTHLYEWMLLMDVIEGRFSQLPWDVSGDPAEQGDDLCREIEESFDRIGRDVELTPCGHFAIARLSGLLQEATVRWRRLRPRCAGRASRAGQSLHRMPSQSKDPACTDDA
jgi:hypothetical protein